MMETPPESAASDPAEVKRPRAILSCLACREKKLKCDRGRPCNNCSKRHHSCRYYSLASPGRKLQPRASTSIELSQRLQRLEELLVVLNNQQARGSEASLPGEPQRAEAVSGDVDGEPWVQSRFYRSPSDPSERREPVEPPSGSILINNGGTTYVEASHWQAILDDIQDVRQFLQQDQTASIPSIPSFGHERSQQPALLCSGLQLSSTAELLAALPPRATVDRLVSRFFNSGEAAIMIIHIPTFQNEYEEFWASPNSVPIAWLGLLYSMLCMGVFFHVRSGQPLPSPLDTGPNKLGEYQARAAQCLSQSDYTKPGQYKIEALLTYLGTEYFLSSDAQFGVSVCLAVIIRLAMHMGYHRDSSRFPNISLFDGEMRSRAWALISQVERLTSFQMGIPSMIDRAQCSTKSPHHYQDVDLHQDMDRLPPERLKSEKTVLSYVIAKDKMINAFGDIVDAVSCNSCPSYETIIELDAELERARESLPPHLSMRSLSMSFTDSADTIMQRFNLDLLYLKARCVLHRQYMTQSTSNPRYAGSRAICVDAARRALRHQADIYLETKPGGQLHQDRWFISSLTTTDFLLAAMILCLELSRRIFERTGPSPTSLTEESQAQIMSELERSRQLWLENVNTSRDAARASEAIAKMLQHVKSTTHIPATPSTPGSAAAENCKLSELAEKARNYNAASQSPSAVSTEQSQQNVQQQPSETTSPDAPGSFDDLLESHGFDWMSWDMAMMPNDGAGAAELTGEFPMDGVDVDVYTG